MKTLLAPTLAALAFALGGCSFLAVQTAPPKLPATVRTPLAQQADAVFWRTLHGGRYDGIGAALEIQTAAYLENPNDAVTAARAGWLHIWRLAESSRLASVPATITNDAVMARRYFEEAVALAPDEARYVGFLGSTLLAEGAIHKDEALTRRGYYTLRDGIDAWPEFNLFTGGYVMSGQAHDSARFREGLAWQWRTLDLCVGEPVDRKNPDFARYMRLATPDGPKRACWNSWIAPHNFEGFFLNMGDMLVKSGDWQTAQKVYANARHSPDFAAWKFREVLEARIRDAPANVAVFTADRGRGTSATPMMFSSPFACSACHMK
jgi:hypothetical protein